MSNEKQQQILQMAKDICRVKLNCNDVCNPISACDALKYAERAVEAGYTKQEWISVADALPEVYTEVLVYTKYGVEVFEYIGENIWRTDNKLTRTVRYGITHWLPLPEAPKGGAE